MSPYTRRSGGSAFPPRLPILIETGEEGPLDDPLHRFTFARCGLAVRRVGDTAAPGSQALPARAPRVPGVPGSPSPRLSPPPGRAPQAPGPSAGGDPEGGLHSTAGCARRPGTRTLLSISFTILAVAGRNHTSFCRIRWERIRGARRSLQPSAAARLLFIATGRSTAGRGGRARAAGTRSLASRARHGASTGHAQATPPRGWSGNQICRGRSNNRLLEQLWDSSSAGPAAGPALRFQGEELAQAPGAAPGSPSSQTPPCAYTVGS